MTTYLPDFPAEDDRRRCPTPEALGDFLADRLHAEAERAIAAHLEACESCQARLGDFGPESFGPRSRSWLLQQTPRESAGGLHELKQRLYRLGDTDHTRSTPAIAFGAEAPNDGAEAPQQIGRFVVERKLGSGGFGVVLLADDPVLKRRAALKLPRNPAALDPAQRARFLREAQAAARLQHPNIVTVYEAGEADGLCYLAAAYCEGPDLAAWFERQASPLAPRVAAEVVAALAGAVEHAHQHGILHRDIKPSNVLLDPTGKTGEFPFTPKLSDFGLAKLVESDADATMTGQLLGTPRYMAPEQAEARREAIGPASDVYALGVVLYELLTGRPPIAGGDNADTLRRVVSEHPPAPRKLAPQIPHDLEAICLKCLEKSPGRRYASAAALADDLRRFLSGEPTEARPVGRAAAAIRWARRRPVWAALGGVSLAALLTIAGGGWWYSAQLRAALEEARASRQRSDDLRYAADLRAAWQAFSSDNAAQAKALLDRMAADPGESGRRGFAWRLLSNFTQQDLLTMTGHQGDVYSAAFSPDGRQLASASSDRTVRLWNVAAAKCVAALAGHADEVNAVVWSPDGRLVASAGDDGAVRFWDAAAHRELAPPLRFERGPAVSLAYAPNGERLAVGDDAGRVVLYDAKRRRAVKTIETEAGRVHAVAFSSDGRWLAAATEEKGVLVWNAKFDRPPIRDEAMSKYARGVVFDRRGRLLACGFRWAYVWDFGAEKSPQRIAQQPDWLYSLALCQDDRLAAIGGKDELVRIFDVPTAELRGTIIGHADRVWSVAASPDGRRLASASADKTIRLYNALHSRAELIADRFLSLNFVAFTPDGRSLLTAGADGSVEVWNLQPKASRDNGPAWTIAGTAYLGPPSDRAAENAGAEPHPWIIAALAVSPTGELAATCNARGMGVQLWDLRTRTSAGDLIGPQAKTTGKTLAAAFSVDGRLLAEAAGDSIHLWQVESRQIARVLSASTDSSVTQLAFSGDGERLAAVAGSDIVLWDVGRSKIRTRWRAHHSRISAIAFGRGGLLASASRDRLVRLWDGNTGKAVASLSGHTDEVFAVAFSPDGRLLASGGRDQTVRLWSLESYEELATLRGFQGPVQSLAFSPMEMLLAASGATSEQRGQLRLWYGGAGPWRPKPATDSP